MRWLEPDPEGRPRLCLLLTRALVRAGTDPGSLVERCAAAGLDAVQVREKDASASEVLALVHELRERLRGSGVAIAVNDRADLALAAGADAVHLGQDDLPPAQARALARAHELAIGLSTHDLEQAQAAGADPAVDYLGIGPLFPTATKGYARGIGAELALAMQRAAGKPAYWIGGIDPARVHELRGAFGFAVSSAILGAEDPVAVVRALRAPRA
ncbi:MAG: thiamine phosphate synthase [Planctomycetes bacterium]|nr:thiamine phosphate synthase [Planctomycetota bacterium]